MRHPSTVNAAHVTRGARRHKHIPSGQFCRRSLQVQYVTLSSEHQPMFGLGVDFHLRVIGSQMALTTCARQTREFDRRSMPCVAGSAVSDSPVFMRTPHAVTTDTTALCSWRALERCQRVHWSLYPARLVLFRKRNLLRGEIFVPRHCRPGGSGMPAMQKLLVNGFMASTAISRCNRLGNNKSIVIRSFLALRDLVAIQAIKPLLRVSAHLKFVHNRILGIQMALRALAAGSHERRARLLHHYPWSPRADQIRRQNQRRRYCDRNEHPAKIHVLSN